MRNLSETCQECEALDRCPGRPPAGSPTSGFPKYTGRKDRLRGRLLGEVHIAQGPGKLGDWYCKLIQKIEWEDGSQVVRFCYYAIKPDGKAAWGQFAPMLNPGQLEVLLARAREKGILPF